MSASVTSPDPGGTEPSRVRHAARKMSSVRGPQNPAKIRRKRGPALQEVARDDEAPADGAELR